MPPRIQIREETLTGLAAIRSVNEAAFGRKDEAELVDRLRHDGAALLSLVAECEGAVCGHILFSRMTIEGSAGDLHAVALAPLAVMPARQRQGIGGELIHRGLEILRHRGERIVIVLGHPAYYPRFGFSAALARQLESPFPRDAFMALELVPAALAGVTGRVRYPPAFGL